jgi:hypothetical protein
MSGVVVCMEAFKAVRVGGRPPKAVACPLCDVPASGDVRGDTVTYVCEGTGSHARLRWEHSRVHVA